MSVKIFHSTSFCDLILNPSKAISERVATECFGRRRRKRKKLLPIHPIEFNPTSFCFINRCLEGDSMRNKNCGKNFLFFAKNKKNKLNFVACHELLTIYFFYFFSSFSVEWKKMKEGKKKKENLNIFSLSATSEQCILKLNFTPKCYDDIRHAC